MENQWTQYTVAIFDGALPELTGIELCQRLRMRKDMQGLTKKRQICCLDDLINDVVEELAALALSANVMLTAQI